jgi:hypothetical protein
MRELLRSYNDHGTLTSEAAIHYTEVLDNLDWRCRAAGDTYRDAYSLVTWFEIKAKYDSKFKPLKQED